MADGQAPIGVPLTPVKQGRGSYVGLVQIIGLKIVGVVVMILLVASFTFFLVRLLPGDPVKQAYEQLIMQGASPEQAARQVEVLYGFVSNEPLYLQYVHYLWRLLHFDLGESISYAGLSVSHLVASAAPFTIVLVLTGIMASFLFGVALGVLAAMRRGTKLGDFISITGSMLHGIPQFVMALLLLYVFSTLLELFPYGAPYSAGLQPGLYPAFIGSLLWHGTLPVVTYALSSYGGWLLATKSSVVSVLGDDFIMAAELRGLKRGTVMRYIARNAMLPLFTILTLSIGFMFGGSLFIESTFNYQGLGTLLLSAIGVRDYPLMSGSFLLISVAVIVANAISDALYVFIDPRVRRSS